VLPCVKRSVLALLAAGLLLQQVSIGQSPSPADTSFDQFVKSKTTSPPWAYYLGAIYLRQFGVNAHSGEVRSWMTAFEQTAPTIYAKRDADFGLFSGGMSTLLKCPLWFGSRGNYPLQDLFQDSQGRMAILYPNTNVGFTWLPNGLNSVIGSKSPHGVASIILFDDGDWQAVVNDKPANSTPTAVHRSLYDALVKLGTTVKIEHVASFANGGWIIVFDSNGYTYNQISDALLQELKKANDGKKTIRYIGEDRSGNWIMVRLVPGSPGWEASWSAGLPADLISAITNEHNANHSFEAMELYPDDSWFLKTHR